MTALWEQKLEIKNACVARWLALYDSRTPDKQRDMLESALVRLASTFTLEELNNWRDVLAQAERKTA